MKKVLLNVSEEVKRLLPETLEKNLRENEEICPVCHGLGIIKRNQPYGLKNENARMNWYDNEYFVWCPNCYFGVVKLCEFCGKPLTKGNNRCNCEEFKRKEREAHKQQHQKLINKAKEATPEEITYYLYDDQSDKYFSDECEFVEYYWQEYLDGGCGCNNFDEYFKYEVPKVLWTCTTSSISINVEDILTDACEDLHEDAYEQIEYSDKVELQKYLNDWCKNQTGTTTYYPDYDRYIRVEKSWFDED